MTARRLTGLQSHGAAVRRDEARSAISVRTTTRHDDNPELGEAPQCLPRNCDPGIGELPTKLLCICTVVLGLASALTSTSSDAAVFCATTSTELKQALTTAASNGEADTIKIETGTYVSSGSGSVAFNYQTSENFSLTVAGGYTSNLPTRCARQLQYPTTTILSGSDARQVLRFSAAFGTNGDLSLSNLTLRDGFTSQTGAGVSIGSGGFSGNIEVNRVIVERNVSLYYGGGMGLYTEGSANIRNSMFLLNRCTAGSCALTFSADATASFGNNTIVGNRCNTGSSCTVTGAFFGGHANATLYNNVFSANSNGDLHLSGLGGGTFDLYHNNVVSITGIPPGISEGNIALANPHFVDRLNDDFRPTLDSPLVNAGTNQFALQSLDLAGKPRINEGVVDIGAYENSERIFADAFELFE